MAEGDTELATCSQLSRQATSRNVAMQPSAQPAPPNPGSVGYPNRAERWTVDGGGLKPKRTFYPALSPIPAARPRVPLAGIEPALSPPEGDALSAELQGRMWAGPERCGRSPVPPRRQL
jgi:hypothetical protein